jgi:hypothetical protein
MEYVRKAGSVRAPRKTRLSVTHLAWTALGVNLGVRCEGPATEVCFGLKCTVLI